MRQSSAAARSSLLVFGAPDIREDEIREVVDSLRSGWLGPGQKVARLEEDFRRYKAVAHAVAVSSCSAAIELALRAAGIGPGDEVITTPLTFCATVNAVIHAGATPVLADIDPRTRCLDPAEVGRRITDRTRAILPVHFAGYPCDMSGLLAVASRRGLAIIEDCAHAIETEHEGARSGTIGEFGCFSFYANKNVAAGDGGMVIARSGENARRIRALSQQGLDQDAWTRFQGPGFRHHEVVDIGLKASMTDLHAAIAIHQLARVEESWSRRRQIWRRYIEELGDLPIVLPEEPPPGSRHAYHLFTILVDPERCGLERDRFLSAMLERHIGVGVHYRSLPEHAGYRSRLGWRPEDYPLAATLGRQTASLPLSPALSDDDVEDVIAALRETLLS